MAAATTIIAVGALAIAAGATFASIQQQKKAAKKQQKLADLENRRERRRLIRERLAEQGRQENLGANISGQTGSLSGIQGGITSAASLAGGEVGFVNQSAGLNKQINRHLRRASFFSGVAGFAQTAGGALGGIAGSFGGGTTGSPVLNASADTRSPSFRNF